MPTVQTMLPNQQDTVVNWDLTIQEPILAVKLYASFAFVSFAVPILHLLKNWIAFLPFKRIAPQSSQGAAILCGRQAKGLQRWMGLNVLAWLAVTAAEFSNGLKAVMVSKRVGVQVIAFALNDLTLPLITLLCVMMILYIVRWHILWRAESLSSE